MTSRVWLRMDPVDPNIATLWRMDVPPDHYTTEQSEPCLGGRRHFQVDMSFSTRTRRLLLLDVGENADDANRFEGDRHDRTEEGAVDAKEFPTEVDGDDARQRVEANVSPDDLRFDDLTHQ